MSSESTNYISMIMQRYDYRRRAWGYAGLFLLLFCFADTGIAQSPTAPTVSILPGQPNATVWEGGTIRFRVEISRPLVAGERLAVPLRYAPIINAPTSGATVITVPGNNPNIGVNVIPLDIMQQGNDPPVFNTTVTFVGAGARTATLQWRFGDDNILDGDREAQIVIGRIESSNISPEPIPDPANDRLTVTVWEDEYIIEFDRNIYVVNESENLELRLIIKGINPSDRVTNFGLRASDTVMFRYVNFTATADDYTPVSGSTIPPSTTSFVVEIPIVNDPTLEINELFRIVINRNYPLERLADNTLQEIRTIFADLIIEDDDDVRVTITAPRTVIAGNLAIFTITRTTPPISPDDINDLSLRAASIDAALTMELRATETNDEGRDYVPSVAPTEETTATVTIPVGETMVTHEIPTVDDGSGRSSSRLTVRIDGSTFVSSVLARNLLRVIVGNPEGASLSVVPERAIVRIRSKVFLEGPLQ